MQSNTEIKTTSASVQYYQALFESVSHPLIAIDNNGMIVDLNTAYIGIFLQDKLIAKDLINCDLVVAKSVINPALFNYYQSVIQKKTNNMQIIKFGELNNQFIIKVYPVCVDNEIAGSIFIHEDNKENVNLRNALYKKNRQLNELQEVAGLGSWELDLSTGKADWTRKEYLLLGYEDGEVEAIPDNFINRIHEDDKERALKELDRPFEDDSAGYEAEFRLVMPDGQIRHIAERGQVIRDKNNKPTRYVGTTLDITRRKKAEEELIDYRDHLEELIFDRTKELEAFSHSLSHDLRAPLRSINGFCSALYEDYYAMLDDTGKDYMERILASTEKMGDMIQGMLRVARIATHPIEIEEIDLSEMARKIISDQLINFPDRKIEAEVQENIIVKSDRKMLLIALQNLVENALKYSSKQPVSQIAFGTHCEVANGLQVYFIRDNGVGFDMQHADNIFGTFKRLHRENEFEGLGIGLSTVRRIISHLHGRIWVESELGKGATFYFSLDERVNA
jgi:PAS domain S-box-containing protein